MRILIIALAMVMLLSASAFARPEVQLNIPEYTLKLVDNGRVLKEYLVAVGVPYEQTPVGNFLVAYKEKHPTWIPGSGFVDKTPVPPGPNNPLGTRWIEFLPAYGIHGTDKAWSIEYPVSGGCIRMYNVDVEELYELVEIGTPVIITYQTMKLQEKPDGLYLRVYADIYNKNITTKENFELLVAPYRQQFTITAEPKWPLTVQFLEKYELKIATKPPIKRTP
jgi:L,D-transpeptidase ErfK/SrfK